MIKPAVVLGLTGSMGSGKSTAAAYFEECGFRRLDSDEIVHRELLPAPEIIAAIREHMGDGVVRPDGTLDRGAVARRVFNDDGERVWLEDLLHPRVVAAWQREWAARSADARWVVEVPLLFERDLQKWFDFTVCVASSFDLQLSRLELRGVTPEHSRQRIAKQLPLFRKIAAADFVLLNDGSRAFLREQVAWLAARWR